MGNKIPSSWFDDPEWELLRRKAENRPIPKKLKQEVAAQRPQPKAPREQPRAQAHREVTDKEVVVNLKIALPKLGLPNPKELYRRRKKAINLAAVALVTVILVLTGGKYFTRQRQLAEDKEPKSPTEQAQTSFNPLVPLTNVKSADGSAAQPPDYQYDQTKKVLAYTTEYNGANLTISQQALPEKFTKSSGGLQTVAKSINATDSIDTQKGTAYVATDDEGKSQTAVFATDEVLVFVRANKRLDNDEWQFYINQLNPSQ